MAILVILMGAFAVESAHVLWERTEWRREMGRRRREARLR